MPTASRGQNRLTVGDIQRYFQTQTNIGKFRFNPHDKAPVGALNN